MIKRSLPDFSLEKEYSSEYNIIVGVDEVGRGCLAGPVFAAVAYLKDEELYLSFGINDSKLLTKNKREAIYKQFIELNTVFEYSSIDADEIDKINILQASKKAMIESINKLKIKPDFILVDGNQRLNIDINQKTIIKGDSKSLSIASASIIAKFLRDEYMSNIVHAKYPQYGFDRHKGYATKEHFKALEKYGETEFHRKTFLRKFYIKQISLF
ncbi:MAG: ribonuclease HII [Candidatus Kapabacteria bacterium]|nr:ribonuclease HII [Candidatus Kapabacteria bacterium]